MISHEVIIQLCSSYYDMTPEDLRSVSRKKKYNQARQLAIKIIRDENGTTLMDIAKIFNRVHHTTILSNLRKINNEIQVNKSVRRDYHSIKNALNELRKNNTIKIIEATPHSIGNSKINIPTDEFKKLESQIRNGNVQAKSFTDLFVKLVDCASVLGISTKEILRELSLQNDYLE